jgi:hypothetical protein
MMRTPTSLREVSSQRERERERENLRADVIEHKVEREVKRRNRVSMQRESLAWRYAPQAR